MATTNENTVYKTTEEGQYNKEITLERLSDMSSYEVADGYPDVRGWKVNAGGEFSVGEVKGLVSSKELERVLYLDVKVDDSSYNTDDTNLYLLVPIGLAFLDKENKSITVRTLDADAFLTYPRYDGKDLVPDYECIVHNYVVDDKDQVTPYQERHAGIYTHDVYQTPAFYEERANTIS